MSKITKKQLHNGWYCHDTEIIKIKKELRELKQSVLRLEKLTDEKLLDEPQLKQLDQSVFDGLDEKWKSAATNTDGKAYLHNMSKSMMYFNHSSYGWCSKDYDAHEMQLIGDGFDPSGFAVGFIERDVAKELLEVDLSSELTGSELCKAMLARGDKFILCGVSDGDDSDAANHEDDDFLAEAVIDFDDTDGLFGTTSMRWNHAVPINNQGEPLTASEVGL